MDLFELQAKLKLDIDQYVDQIDKAQSAAHSFGSKIGSAFRTIAKVGAVAIGAATTALAKFGVDAVQTGMEFDKSMSQVAATMGKTVDEIQELRDFAMEMGAKTVFSATQAADALNYMALAGYDANKSMAMLPNVLNLAAAGNMDLARASDMVTDAESALGLTTEQVTAMVDQMAQTASKSNTSVEQLGDAMLTIGGTAQFMAGGTDRLQTVLGLLADNGIKGSEAGTHLRNMLLKLSAPSKDGAMWIERLGLKVYDAEGNMRDMQDIILDLSEAMADMTDEQKVQAISDIFNARDVAAVNALLGTSKQRWDELGASIKAANGSAAQMAETQLDNLTGDITLLKSALEGAKIVVSDQLTPTFREFVQFGTQGIQRLTDAFKADGLNGAMSEFGKLLSEGIGNVVDDLPSIVEAGAVLVDSLVRGIADNLPKLGEAAIQIVKILAKTISKNIGSIVKSFASAIVDIVDELTKPSTISELIDAGIDMATSIVDGLIEAVPKIVNAVPKIIKNLTNAFAKNSGKILKAANDLFFNITAALLQTAVDITKQMPTIIKAIVDGLGRGARSIISAVGEMVFGITSKTDQAIDAILNRESDIKSFANAVREMEPQLASIDSILSESGKTVGQLDDMIATTEESITKILQEQLESQEGLRQQDLMRIGHYMQELTNLQLEKIETYRSRQRAQLTMIGLEANEMTIEQGAQFVANAQAALDDANEATKQAYEQRLTIIENEHNMENGITDEQYASRLKALKEQMDKEYAANQQLFDDTLKMVGDASTRWVETDTIKWRNLAKIRDQAYEDALQRESGFIDASTYHYEDYAGQYSELLTGLVNDNSSAFLQMISNTAKNGMKLTKQQQNIANNMISAFDDVPRELEDVAKTALEQMLDGMEDAIPGLQDMSSMTAQEIVNVLKKTLSKGGMEYSQVKAIGEKAVSSISAGMESKRGQVELTAQQIGNGITDKFKASVQQMQEAGKQLVDGVWVGMSAQEAKLLKNVRGMMDRVNNTVRAVERIQSPSKVMAEIGEYMALGIGVGWQRAFGEVSDTIENSLTDIVAPDMQQDSSNPFAKQDQLLGTIVSMLADIKHDMSYDIVLNDGLLVGRLDKELGQRARLAARGFA